jgi:hypothetical protein
MYKPEGWTYTFNYQQGSPETENLNDEVVRVFRARSKPEGRSATVSGNEDKLISHD